MCPNPLDEGSVRDLVEAVREREVTDAVILTSFHQSPLPLALLLRLAGVDHVAATSVDYPGSLLDVRVAYREQLHEVEQSLLVCLAAGYALPPGDDGRLMLRCPSPVRRDHVVVHLSASVPARGIPDLVARDLVRELARCGRRIVLTGSEGQRSHALDVASGTGAEVLCGTTTFAEFVDVIASAAVVVCGNTAAAHVAAATGTPAVVLFAPVVDPFRWRPWAVEHVLLGDLDIACAGCRARACPIAGQPCVGGLTGRDVVDAVDTVAMVAA
jgi:ADP-heptose:LPS heptosyltransferase